MVEAIPVPLSPMLDAAVAAPIEDKSLVCDRPSDLPPVARIRAASPFERRTLESFLDSCGEIPAVARRISAIIATIDCGDQADIARASNISQPTLRKLQRAYASAGPLGLVEGRSGWAGSKSSLPSSMQDQVVAEMHDCSVRALARQVRASKSSTHRLMVNAREVARYVGIGGGYSNPRHYFLVSGIAARPKSLSDQKPLCATYVELFAKRSDSDWDLGGCNRVLAYLAAELSHLDWKGNLHVVANPRLAAAASSSAWFGSCEGVVVHPGPNARIWHHLLDYLVALRPPGWHCRALRALRSLNTLTANAAAGSSFHWITEYLSMMEWRASRSPWKSVEFTRLATSLHAAQQNPRLSAQLLGARKIMASDPDERFRIYPIWD